MKKRIFALLLATLLLTSLASCSKQEPEYGTFYTEDGIVQNTLITLVLEEDNLTAPVQELSFSLQEKSDWYVQKGTHISGTECTHLVEVYTDGVWTEVKSAGILKRDWLGNFSPDDLDYQAHHTYDGKMAFYALQGIAETQHYLPLGVGYYRIRVKYSLYADDETARIPEEQLEAVAYFTVVADTTRAYEYGTFFTEDGILQNTAITLEVENQDLVAPVKELEYVLHDNSDYWVDYMDNYKANVSAKDVLEIYEDGAWRKVEVCGQGMTEIWYRRTIGEPTERKDYHIKMRFYDPEDGADRVLYYAYLKPGSYRLRVTYWIFTYDTNVYIPEGQLEAVAYFTVTAPTE